MSVQSLNGDSYQGAQVGANVQSQVGIHRMYCQGMHQLSERRAFDLIGFPLFLSQERIQNGPANMEPKTSNQQLFFKKLSPWILPTLCECIWLWPQLLQ